MMTCMTDQEIVRAADERKYLEDAGWLRSVEGRCIGGTRIRWRRPACGKHKGIPPVRQFDALAIQRERDENPWRLQHERLR